MCDGASKGQVEQRVRVVQSDFVAAERIGRQDGRLGCPALSSSLSFDRSPY